MEIRGKVALVTGASSGIGRATAVALAREGAKVVVADVDEPGGAETVRLVREVGSEATFIKADVSTAAGVDALFGAAEKAFGGLDIVHNNAGIMTGGAPGWPEVGNEKIALVVGVNAAGVMMGTRAGIHALRRRGGGAIVNTASVAALAPMPNDPIYAATKAAVKLFTESLAGLRESDNIRVNTVLPGMVDTPIIAKTGDGKAPAKWLEPAIAVAKMLKPEEIASAVVELIKDETAAGQARVVANQPPGVRS